MALCSPGFTAWTMPIAAIARIHRLTVVTRNVADFSRFGVGLLNPFTGAESPAS